MNTKYKIFTTHENAFSSFLKDVENAKKRILVSVYKLGNDSLGHKLIEILVKKAENINVEIIVDHLGLGKLSKNIENILYNSKIKFTVFNPILPIKFHVFLKEEHRRLHSRNHHKLTIIDDFVYVGGMNFAVSENNWHDIHLRLSGDVVNDFVSIFKEIKQIAKKKMFIRFKKVKKLTKTISKHQDIAARQIPYTREKQIRREILYMINSAKENIQIITPYFIPDLAILQALLRSLKRNVRVNLIIPKQSDLKFIDVMTRWFSARLIRRGGFVYRHQQMIHSKLVIVDNSICTVGSCNIDYRSLHLNYEVNYLSKNKTFVKKIQEIFKKEKHLSKIYSRKKWLKRSFFEKIIESILHPIKKYL